MLLGNLNRYFTGQLWDLTNMDKSLWKFGWKALLSPAQNSLCTLCKPKLSWQNSFNTGALSQGIICKKVATPNVGKFPAHHHPFQVQSSDLVISSYLFSIQLCWDDALGNSPLAASGFIPRALCRTGGMGLCCCQGKELQQTPTHMGSTF